MTKHQLTMKTIQPLVAGDTVAIVAPAGFLAEQDISIAIETITGWGLNPQLGSNIFGQHSVFAGTDRERAADLQHALDDPSVKAIFCARGGYGSIRTLAHIDWSAYKRSPKLICGFSDITAIHSYLGTMPIPSLHSIMPINFPRATPEALESFRKSIFGEPIEYCIAKHQLNKPGTGNGIFTGGNLSIIMSIKGTEYETDCAGKILFLEDVGETNYHLDRMMQNIKRTMFPHISGLVVGQFTEMKDGRTPFGMNAEEIIADACNGFAFPVCFGFPAGHVPDNRSLWMNAPASLHVGESVKLKF